MKKAKVVTVILACAMLAGCGTAPASGPADVSSTAVSEPQIVIDIKGYFKSNSEYTLKDIRVVEEDSTYTIVTSIGTEYSIDDFVPYVEQILRISEEASVKFNVTFSRINPALYTDTNAWIGWSNDTLNFYNQDKYLVENVPLEMLKNEVEKYKSQNGYSSSSQAAIVPQTPTADALAPFQGTWKKEKSSSTLIISGNTVNFPHYLSPKHKEAVTDMSTFYFVYNEYDQLIVVNQHQQPRYLIEIREDGTLVQSDIDSNYNVESGEEPDLYIKESDSITVPEVKLKPTVGMTEKDVILSLWGYPKKKNKTTTANSTTEQWVYDEGYIYFKNGIVTAIQET